MSKSQILDVLERAAWTFAQAFFGIFSVALLAFATEVITWANAGGEGEFPSFAVLGVAAIGAAASGVAALVSLAKGLIAVHFGNGSASTLPASSDPVPADDVVEIDDVDELQAAVDYPLPQD